MPHSHSGSTALVSLLPPAPTSASSVRRRAAHACERCHSKKIKCDLQPRSVNGIGGPCKHCQIAEEICIPRTSQRNLQRRKIPRLSSGDGDVTRRISSHGQVQSPSLPSIVTAIPARSGSIPNTSHEHEMPLVDIAPAFQFDVPMDIYKVVGLAPNAGETSTHPTYPDGACPTHSDGGAVQGNANDGVKDNEAAVPSATATATEGTAYLGDSGYMSMFSPTYTAPPSGDLKVELNCVVKPLSQTLRTCYSETFNDQCSTFCPVFDDGIMEDPEFGQSLLLQQALALVSSRIQPSLLDGEQPATYYKKARELFHTFTEPNPTASLIALMLFYWYSTVSPNILSMDGPWYWTGVAIRQAQEMGLHQRTRRLQHRSLIKYPTLGRRIWWTLFARERLTSMCQGRPCIINIKDCDVSRLTASDLPGSSPTRAGIFIQWVNLCEIVGWIAKHLRRHPDASQDSHRLHEQLKDWAWSLPEYAKLSYVDGLASNFNRDVCQLHLPYLSSLTLLDLKRCAKHHSSGPPVVAMLASSCVAKIFENLLMRGSLRFLQGMAGWYITIALLALLPAHRIPAFTTATEGPIHILRVALKDMAQRWPSSKMFENGINTLLVSLTGDSASGAIATSTITDNGQGVMSESQFQRLHGLQQRTERSFDVETLGSEHIQLSLKYFPGATTHTTLLFDVLLSLTEPVDLPAYADDFSDVLFDFFENNIDTMDFNIL